MNIIKYLFISIVIHLLYMITCLHSTSCNMNMNVIENTNVQHDGLSSNLHSGGGLVPINRFRFSNIQVSTIIK